MSTEMDPSKPFKRLVVIADPDMQLDEATGRASFIFNTEDVGRDGHVVRNAGIRTKNYSTNPVILWAHDDSAPPVGRAVDIQIGEPASRVAVEFTPPDLYPFGDMIGRMVKARYLNAVSESWQPIKAKRLTGGDGYDFQEVDLLEISIVPVPALPQAIATARAAGINTAPMVEWAEKVLDAGGLATIKRADLETLRRAAAMPARRRSAGKPAKETPVTLKEKLARALKRAPKVPAFRRGLYDVAQLAYLLASLGYCHESSEFEEALEEDTDSVVPAMLGEALKALGNAMIEMTQEEVGELLARVEDPENGAERALNAKARKWVREATTPAKRTWRLAIALCRDAESLPADSVEKLSEAHEQHKRAAKHLRAVGEHHEAVGDHIDDARDAHSDLAVEHRHVGEAITAADTALKANEPKEASGHLKRAADHYSQAEGHIAEVEAAHKDAADRCDDAGDSHRSCTRALGKASDCVRSVAEHLQSTEPDAPVGDEVEDQETVRAALAARRATRKAGIATLPTGVTPAASAAAAPAEPVVVDEELGRRQRIARALALNCGADS